MASPYFTPINAPKEDFSVLQNAGQAWSNAYQQGFDAVAKVGTSYFKKKGRERQAESFIKTPMGRDYLKQQGYSEEDLVKLDSDPNEAKKLVADAAKDAGGIDNLMNSVKAQYAYGKMKENDIQQKKLFGQEFRKNQFQLKELENKYAIQQEFSRYQTYMANAVKDGKKPKDAITEFVNDGLRVPQAWSMIDQYNDQQGLGRHNPDLIRSLKKGEERFDVSGGMAMGNAPMLTNRNFSSKADADVFFDNMMKDIPNSAIAEDIKQSYRTRLYDQVDGANGQKTARELFSQGLKDAGFGEYAKTAATNIGIMGNFRALVDESLVTLDDGTLSVKNPVAASVALMQMARMAQGAGMLSNQDVNLIKGDQTISASYDRLINKLIGEEKTLTKEMIEQNPAWSNSVNPDTGEVFKIGDPVTLGGSNVSAADMLMFKSIAEKLDARHEQFTQKVIPDIYKNVRATYNGFTIDELNKYTDLHQYMPNGIVDINPIKLVPQKVHTAVDRMKNKHGMNYDEVIQTLVDQSILAGTYDQDTDLATIRDVVSRHFHNQPAPPPLLNNSAALDYKDYQRSNRKKKPVEVVKDTNATTTNTGGNTDPSVQEVREQKVREQADSILGKSAEGAGAYFATKKATSVIQNKYANSVRNSITDRVIDPKKQMKRGVIKPIVQAFGGENVKSKMFLAEVDKLSEEDLNKAAKEVGIDNKLSTKQKRLALKGKLNTEIQEEVSKRLLRLGFKTNKLLKYFTGGGAGVALFAYDILDILETNDRAGVEAAEQLLKNAKTPLEKEVARELLQEKKTQFTTLGNLIKPSPRTPASQVKRSALNKIESISKPKPPVGQREKYGMY